MQRLKLNGHFSLGVEAENKKLRLVVFNNGEEYVCHKTTTGEFTKFIKGDTEQLFKGRLQLLKNNDNILVKIKGNVEGVVNGEELGRLISLKQKTYL